MLEVEGKQLVVAMDHARAMGAVRGLEDAGAVIDTVIEAGADGIMTSFGTVKAYRDRLIGRVPVYPAARRRALGPEGALAREHAVDAAAHAG